MVFSQKPSALSRASTRACWRCAIILIGVLLQQIASAANVSINATNQLATVAATAYGVHTSVYDNQNGNASLPNLLIQSGVGTLRYPGGGYADIFHWSVTRNDNHFPNGTGSSTPWFGAVGDYGYIGSKTDFGNFVKLLSNANAQALITVNYGSALQWDATHTELVAPATNAQPQEAAAWVAYANAETNLFGTVNDVNIGVDVLGNDWKTAGFWAMLRAAQPLATDDGYNFLRINRRAPVGIKYWEIGNEIFGAGYYDGSGGYSVDYALPYDGTARLGSANLSPAFYGQQVNAFAQMMRAVDPTVKIGAVVSTPPGDYSWDAFGGQRWTPQVLAQCASNIDFVIAHWYPFAGNNANGNSLLSQVGSTIPFMIEGKTSGLDTGTNSGLRDWINTYRSDGTNVQIFISEFGYMGSLAVSNNNAPVLGPVDALFAADSYATWLDFGVANVDYLEMNKVNFLGDSSPLRRGAVYYAIQMVQKMAAGGDEMLNATSDTSSLRVHAALRQDGKMGLLLINESRTSSQTANVTIPNVPLATVGTLYQFGITNFPAPGSSGMPSSGESSNSVSNLGNSFSLTVPAYTMMVLTIPILSNTPPVLAAVSNRVVNVGQIVAFTVSATDPNQPPQTLTFSLLSGPINATIDPASGNFLWRPDVSQSGATNIIVLKVSDNGVPTLSATQSFTAVVAPLSAPAISSAGLSNGEFAFQINGPVGPDYAVQVSTNLFDWTTLGIAHSPAMPFLWLDTNFLPWPAQYYRVKAGPPLP